MKKKNIFKVILAILTFFVSIASSYGQCWFTELLKLSNENKVSKEYALLVTDSKKGIQSFEAAQSSGNKALLDYNNFKKFNELSSDLQEAVAKLPGEGNNSLTKQYLSEVDEGKRANILNSLSNKLEDKAREIVIKAFGRDSQFAKDDLVLNKITEFLQPSNKITLDAIGGEKGLQDIIIANVRAGCSTCGNASTSFLKNMDEYLDDVLYFGNTFAGKEGFDKVIKELKVINTKGGPNYSVEGATFMLRKIKETPEITANSIKKFDGVFEGEIDKICVNCRFDIELITGKKFEYKSYGSTSINRISSSDAFLKQHLSYLEDTKSLDQMVYEFDKLKFSNRDKIVEQFRKMYEKNASDVFNVIWNNKEFRNSIFDMSSYPTNISDGQLKTILMSDFKSIINKRDSKLYNFIKLN
ncbi:MAG: hypothetical protein LBI73_14855 [Myroides sp.]|nr:hypothetical protein [Myroides sp.]